MLLKSWVFRNGQLLSVAVVAVLALSIAGCPGTPTPPADDPPPGQTLDGDGDGVVDEDDTCPNTPEGEQADADGCAESQLGGGGGTPPVVVDDDGDGVANDDDDCPDTPSGEAANASGCSASERDTDGDGVNDDADDCASTPSTVTIDATGCPVGDPGADDTDGDGVGDDIDQCLSTPAREDVDANGCSPAERDTDGDGVMDADDTCPDTAAGEVADADGCSDSQLNPPSGGGGGPGGGGQPVCGNSIVEAGEGCDDGNTTGADGCSSACQVEGPSNDSCGGAMIAVDGTQSFTSVGATTDGPDEPTMCDFFGRTQVEADIWYCYTASCTGEAVASLCGSNYDTKMAIYNGCGCPSEAAAACSDDDCGTAVGNIESSATFQAVAGEQYTIRIGGFNGEQGDGRLTITCAPPACGTTDNDCFADSTEGLTGCNDAACCEKVCAVDRFCCDVSWDSFCASEAAGLCTDGFPACQVGIGSCQIPRDASGCGTVDCCNTVCGADPFCCIDGWDETCVNEANSMCFLTCGARSGDCFTGHDDAGCNSVACCALVCGEDPFCCETTWDAECATKAENLCR